MTRILAIDPGPEQSASVLYDETAGLPLAWAKVPNEDMRHQLDVTQADLLAVEMIASYGMSVGQTTFSTCVWAGRFIERWLNGRWAPALRPEPILLTRKECVLHVCNSPRAGDPNVRAALIDRYGGKDKAIGLKKNPGPLYGMRADCWQALAVAVTAAETRLEAEAA